MLTPDQIQIVKLTWRSYRDVDPELLGEVFYTKLFMEYPSLKSLFKRPIEQQYLKLIDILNVLIARLDRQHEVVGQLELLGKRHQGYGVKPQHYIAVGNALLWTLKAGLGDRWTRETEAAWKKVYELVATAMLQAK